MKPFFLCGILTFIVLAGLVFMSNQGSKPLTGTTSSPQAKNSEEIKASFAIFTNGTFRIFTDERYHNLSQRVYIEGSSPNTVHVKGNLKWDDFFKTLPMKLTKDCLTTGTGQVFCTDNDQKLRFYINEKEDKNALLRYIKSGDRLLVTYGNYDEAQIQNQFLQIPRIK